MLLSTNTPQIHTFLPPPSRNDKVIEEGEDNRGRAIAATTTIKVIGIPRFF
jgi:hypothetical protein